MHGLGNDFVVIDLVSQNARLSPEQIRFIANRHLGIGCDQLLLVEPPATPDTDFHYRIFNCDGGEVEQCGNGARCFGKFVFDKKLSGKKHLKVSTKKGVIGIDIVDRDHVRVDMGVPELEAEKVPFTRAEQARVSNDVHGHSQANGEYYQLAHSEGNSIISIASMGNPHGVLIVDDVDTAPVETLGPILEAHEQFPERANIGFMEICSRDHIRLRVFERGVGETCACGTGACAAVATGINNGLLDNEVRVSLRGGDLTIQWPGGKAPLIMTGDANKVFDGKIKL